MNAKTGRAMPPDVRRGSGAQVLRIPPPLYYGGAFAGGMWLHAATAPLAIGARPASLVLGAVIVTAGAALLAASVAEVLRHRTTIVPHGRVSALVTTGAFQLSRNPMYTGLAIVYLGGALLAGSAWPLVTLPLALMAVRGVVIIPEERYLARTFGQTYRDYQGQVRRWL